MTAELFSRKIDRRTVIKTAAAAGVAQIASPFVISARAADGSMTLSVCDQGAGLTAHEQSQMWGRFARGERHATTTSGFGLGLWIANAFILANGGTMNAASEGPDLGTTVAIELPVTQAAVQPIESDADD